MPGLRAEAGSRPACESLSFASPKERNQRKGDPTVCVPCASLRGNLWCSGLAGSRSNSLRFTSLRQSRALIRQTLRSSAHPQGQGGQNIHTGLCFAALRSAPTRGRKRHALRRPGQAQRWPEWLFGCLDVRLSHPCWLRLRRGGCGVSMGVEAPMPRELTRRGCLNEAATQRSEFHGAPHNRLDAGLPLRSAKGSQTGGRLSFGYFSLAKQRKVPRPPGRLPASALNQGMRFNQRTKNQHYKINNYQRISPKRIQPKTPQTGPKAIRPDEVTEASLACRVSTRLRPARFAS